uniref:Uncharacterized protein n=1 Tax=Oryza barthii TaxID=65489 RepID=A0A0D3FTL4_9ORYZ
MARIAGATAAALAVGAAEDGEDVAKWHGATSVTGARACHGRGDGEDGGSGRGGEEESRVVVANCGHSRGGMYPWCSTPASPPPSSATSTCTALSPGTSCCRRCRRVSPLSCMLWPEIDCDDIACVRALALIDVPSLLMCAGVAADGAEE